MGLTATFGRRGAETTRFISPPPYRSTETLRETSAQVKAGGSEPARAHSVRGMAGRSERLLRDSSREMQSGTGYLPTGSSLACSGTISQYPGSHEGAAERQLFEAMPTTYLSRPRWLIWPRSPIRLQQRVLQGRGFPASPDRDFGCVHLGAAVLKTVSNDTNPSKL